MPFASKAQRRKFHAMYRRGEIDKKTLDKFEKETGDKKLPERSKTAGAEKTRQYKRKKKVREAAKSIGKRFRSGR